MKRLTLSFFAVLLLSVAGNAQFGQRSWKVYFPAQESMIGRVCTNSDSSPICTGSIIPEGGVFTTTSYADLTTYQKQTFKLKLAEMFKLDRTRIRDVRASNVKVDTLTDKSLEQVERGVTFVFSGLRADTVVITINKELGVKVDPSEIVTKISAAYPNIPLEEIKRLLPDSEAFSESSNRFEITINEPNVHFMIQRAKMDFRPNIRWPNGNENIRVFGASRNGACDYSVDVIVLGDSEPQTCSLTVPVRGGARPISMVLRAQGGKLVLEHTSASGSETKLVEIKSISPGRWQNDLGQPIFRYKYRTTNSKIVFREIYLHVRGQEQGDGTIQVIRKVGKRSFPTRISYPDVELTLVS